MSITVVRYDMLPSSGDGIDDARNVTVTAALKVPDIWPQSMR